MLGDVGAVATLAQSIFKWVTEPEGYQEWSLNRKLEALHAAALKALDAREFADLDTLLAEYKRLREQVS